MSYSEHFEYFYKGLKQKDFSVVHDLIQNYLWDAYDEERGRIIDTRKFKSAQKLCTAVYNDLKEYEDQIEDDLRSMDSYELDYDSVPGIYHMDYICKTYHKFFEYIDDSILFDENEINETPPQAVDPIPEIDFYKKDQNPDHKEWYIDILSSKIPVKQSDKETYIMKCLNRLFDELCEIGCLNPDVEYNRSMFIYRFSGYNDAYPLEWKMEWKGKNTFLGYIVRCLISDKITDPVGLGKVTNFFISKSRKDMNLSVPDCTFEDFEKERNKLHSDFIKAVELLRKCGFVNVEFTSSRR